MSKTKPDYTMFMKKPAPLETRFLTVDEMESLGDPSALPLAEIVNETADAPRADATTPLPSHHASLSAPQRAATHDDRREDACSWDLSQYAFLQGESRDRRCSGLFQDAAVPLAPLAGAVLFLAFVASFLS
jgi:hypothetical protein